MGNLASSLTAPFCASRPTLPGCPRRQCPKQPRVLVTGASGLLGRQVVSVLKENNWDFRGLAYSRAVGSLVKCDLFDKEQLNAQFQDYNPSIVIHCAAERRPDKLEDNEELARKLNVDVASSMAELCQSYGAWMIFLSTNYVFDGERAPYAEDAAPNPLNVYGRSKLAAEQAVAKIDPHIAILRVPLLYGPVERTGETSVTVILDAVLRREPAPTFDDWQERFPTSTEDLARVLEAMASQYTRAKGRGLDLAPFCGVFHWQSNERHTKFSMAKIIAEIASVDSTGYVANTSPPKPGSAPRPQFERMLCTRLEKLLVIGDPTTYRSDFRISMQRHLQSFL